MPRSAAAAAMLLIASLSTISLFAEEVVATAAPKNHVLFVGTDLTVNQNGKYHRVVSAKKGSLQIENGRGLSEVKLGQGASIRVNRGVKLSSLSATISEIKTESIDRASARAQLAAMQTAMALMDEAGDNADRLHGKMTLLSAVAAPSGPGAVAGSDVTAAGIKEMQDAARVAYIGALPDLDRLTSSVSTYLNQDIMRTDRMDDEVTLDASALPGLKLSGGSELGGSSFSGGAENGAGPNNGPSSSAEVELTFNVSSPVPLERAYIVVVANYGSSSKPDEVARQISTQEFGRIDSQPRRVKMRHAASINGRPFRKFDMGLYANGQEVATNLSEKRLPLTSEQAYQFFFIDYLTTHKGATLPPAPMLMIPRAEFYQQVPNSDTNQTIYANVDKLGNVLAMSTDSSGKRAVPPALESSLRNVRFLPALEKGAPVDGRLKFTLAQLVD